MVDDGRVNLKLKDGTEYSPLEWAAFAGHWNVCCYKTQLVERLCG